MDLLHIDEVLEDACTDVGDAILDDDLLNGLVKILPRRVVGSIGHFARAGDDERGIVIQLPFITL